MKPKTTAIARAPQSRGISASLRRLAVRRAGNVLAASALFALSAASAQAQATNYTTTTGSTFSTAFTPTIPAGGTSSANGDGLTFNGTAYTATDDLTSAQPLNLNFLTFGNSGLVTVARGGGSNLVTLGATSGGVNPTVNLNNTGGLMFGLDVALAANTSFMGSGNATFSGVMSGTGGLTQNGTGTLTLGATNTYTGGTTVNSGTLALARGGGAGAVRGVVTVNSGATLNLTANNALGYNAGQQVTTLNINGGTVSVTGNQGDEGYLTSFNLTGGTLAYASTNGSAYQIAAGDTTTAATTTFPGITSNASATTSVISGGVEIRSGNLGFNVASGTTASGVDLLVSGLVTATGTFGLTKTGAGVMALTGANTYTGGTTVSQGTLTVQGTGATLGTGTLAVNNANTGAGTNVIVNFNTNSNQTVNGLSSTVAKPSSGTNTAQVNIAAGSTLTDTQSGTTNYAGSVSGGGTLAIGGQSSSAPATVNYTGTDTAAQTNVNANATLQLNNAAGPVLSSPVAVATSGTVLLGGNNQIATTAPGTASPTNVALNGGPLNANGHSDGVTNGSTDPTQAAVTSSMGTLSLASGASTLDFGSGSTNDIIAFADSLSSLQSGTGTLRACCKTCQVRLRQMRAQPRVRNA